jgi:hypothetical protein
MFWTNQMSQNQACCCNGQEVTLFFDYLFFIFYPILPWNINISAHPVI